MNVSGYHSQWDMGFSEWGKASIKRYFITRASSPSPSYVPISRIFHFHQEYHLLLSYILDRGDIEHFRVLLCFKVDGS
jgi:hypothetical protein